MQRIAYFKVGKLKKMRIQFALGKHLLARNASHPIGLPVLETEHVIYFLLLLISNNCVQKAPAIFKFHINLIKISLVLSEN
jgi:hypothetical protein